MTPAISPIALSHVTFAYGATPIFRDLDLTLAPGWTGLVGANGAGKSTLLALLAGALRPEAGTIRIAPGARVTRLVQVLDAPSPELLAFAASAERSAIRHRAMLGLDPTALSRWTSLSPGERRRWQLGAALDAAPDVLLLDEPEGHLDHRARLLLVNALRSFRGIGVLVAHDRALLDAVTTSTVELEGGAARVFPGPWSAAKAAWDAEREAAEARRRVLKGERQRLASALDQQRRAAAAADREVSAGRRMKDRNDSDARSVLGTTQASWAARSLERGVARRAVALGRADQALADETLERRLDPTALVFAPRPTPQRVLMGGHWDALMAGTKVIARDLSAWVARGDRIHLAGDNGAGKTTLVRALLATATVPAEALLVQPQELSPEATQQALAELRAAPPDVRGKTLQLVAALGASPERLLETLAPSPGEARKLHLALGLARGVSALVLDEPTNHLDLPSIQRLQEALAAWPGTLLLVTHDEALARAVTSTRWTLEGGALATRGEPCHDDP